MPARQTILLAVAVLALTLWLFPTRQGIGHACDLVRFLVKTEGLVLDSVNVGSLSYRYVYQIDGQWRQATSGPIPDTRCLT